MKEMVRLLIRNLEKTQIKNTKVSTTHIIRLNNTFRAHFLKEKIFKIKLDLSNLFSRVEA